MAERDVWKRKPDDAGLRQGGAALVGRVV